MKRIYLSVIVMFMAMTAVVAQKKREFRGAWIQCVNGQFQGMSKDVMQKTLSYHCLLYTSPSPRDS